MSLAAAPVDAPPGRPLRADLLGALALLPVPAAVIGRTGTIVWQNHRGDEVFGDSVGRPLTRFVAPENRDSVVAAFARVLQGESLVEPVVGLDRGGRRVALTVVAAPLTEHGRVAGALAIGVASGRAPAEVGTIAAGVPKLTRRQLETLRLLGEGRSTPGIAAALGVTPETARNHVRALLRRLGVHSRLEAVAAGHRLGLLRPFEEAFADRGK